jgi:hypothetical protein
MTTAEIDVRRWTLRAALADSWPPLLAWIAALAGLWLSAYFSGHPPWHGGTWAHWDSSYYESIAAHGYDVHRCSPGETDTAATWCGNAAWFPGYPLLLAGLHVLGLPILGTGIVVSWVFSAAALVLLWHSFLRDLPAFAAGAGLLFAAWVPGQVYDYAVFPLSMLFFFTVAFLDLLRRCRWAAAGLIGAAAVLTYPVGVTLAIVAAIWITLTLRTGRIRATALAAGPSPLAFVAIVVVQRIQTGRWTAFFDVQSQYGHGFHNPMGVTGNALLVVVRTRSFDFAWPLITSLQTVLVAVVLLAVFLHVAARRRTAGRVDLLLVLWAAVTWALPLTQANVSVWRSQAALAPIGVLVGRLPRPAAITLIVAAAAVAVPVALLFFAGRLV